MLNTLIETVKTRFPSGQWFKPRPVEFKFDASGAVMQKQAAPKEEGEREEAGDAG